MSVLKALGVAVAFFLLARYFPIVYYTIDFNDFVKQEPQRSPIGPKLKQTLLSRAQIDFLPVKADDIRLDQDGDLVRVHVDYKVPVNLFVFTHVLKFHASGAGLEAH